MNVACDAGSLAGCDVGSDDTSVVALVVASDAVFMAAVDSAKLIARDCA